MSTLDNPKAFMDKVNKLPNDQKWEVYKVIYKRFFLIEIN